MSYKLNPITSKLDYYQAASSGGGGITHATAVGTDTYTVTIAGITSYSDADAYLIRFTNGNTGTATLNINGLGARTLYRNNDGVLLGGDIWSGAEMLCVFNSTTNGFQCIGTTSNSLFAYVTNADSVAITKGMPVYAFGGTGDRMTVKRANNTGDATSAQTVGLVMSTSIAAGQKGIIMMQGLLDNLSILPTSTWSDGDPVYLGASDGSITKIKPSAPNHLVYLGVVTTASNGSAGRMYVKVQNGYELDELHNVSAQSPSDKDGIFFNTITQLWESKSIATNLGYTPAQSEGWSIIVKSANQNVTNSSTLVDDTELQFSVVAGGNYMIQMVLATAGDTSINDYKFAFVVSAGTMTGAGNAVCRNASNSATVNGLTVTGASITNAIIIGQIGNINGIVTANIDFGFYATTNGIFKFQFALNSGTSGTARTCKGTILKYKRLD